MPLADEFFPSLVDYLHLDAVRQQLMNLLDEKKSMWIDDERQDFPFEELWEISGSVHHAKEQEIVESLSTSYRTIVLRYSDTKNLSRERAFFEILQLTSVDICCQTYPSAYQLHIREEVRRLFRSKFFNTAGKNKDIEEMNVMKITSKDLYNLRDVGTLVERDALILNSLNTKRKSLHPHVIVTRRECMQSHSPFMDVMSSRQDLTAGSTPGNNKTAKLSRLTVSSSSPSKPPWDAFFNTAGKLLANRAPPADLRAVQASAQNGHASWRLSNSRLSPGNTIQQMYSNLQDTSRSSLTERSSPMRSEQGSSCHDVSPKRVRDCTPHYLQRRGVSILQMAIDDYKLSKTMEKMELDRKELEEIRGRKLASKNNKAFVMESKHRSTGNLLGKQP
mmetsp:Transcript_35263/g.110193  ORF Transcript_35263/g.110193 Transcript_35263/m.110193 type:complete len:391 (-) Transcript_35263:16-1188(-)